MEGAFKLGVWLAVVVLIGRAIACRSDERKAIVAGLIAGLSYMTIVIWFNKPVELPTTLLLEKSYPLHIAISDHFFEQNPGARCFRMVGHFAFATLSGLFVAGLTAYWARKTKVRDKDDGVIGNG
jgi:hypothetical protein